MEGGGGYNPRNPPLDPALKSDLLLNVDKTRISLLKILMLNKCKKFSYGDEYLHMYIA